MLYPPDVVTVGEPVVADAKRNVSAYLIMTIPEPPIAPAPVLLPPPPPPKLTVPTVAGN